MEAFPEQATVNELDDVYGWREIDSSTNFIGVVGMGGSEDVTCQAFNNVFKKLNVNVRCLPLMSQKFDRMKQMLDALKIKAIVTSSDLGDSILPLADELEESARLSQYADLLLNKSNGWQAWNAGWRSAVKVLEQTIGGGDKRPLDKQNVLIIGSGSLAKSMIYGISRRKGLVSVTSPDDVEAKNVAAEFQVRFVPFANLYNTLADVVVLADPKLELGSHKNQFNAAYLVNRHTVCDVTEMPFDSPLITEARGRGARVAEPAAIFADKLSTLLKSIVGKDVPPAEFQDVISAAVAGRQ